MHAILQDMNGESFLAFPATILKELDWEIDTKLEINVVEGKIVIRPMAAS